MISYFCQSKQFLRVDYYANFRGVGKGKEEESEKATGQYGYIPASKNSFRCSQRRKNDLATEMENVQQEEGKKKEEEGVTKRKPWKTYKVTSLGENDCSFCLKVVGPNNSFVTRNLSLPYLPSVVE